MKETLKDQLDEAIKESGNELIAILAKANPKDEAEVCPANAEGNIYETFRPAIVATVRATIIKARDTSVSYNWSIGRVISACAEACKQPITNTPEDFKRIVKFEVKKLRTEVAKNESYELVRSREDYVLSDGQMKGRLTNVHHKFIALEKQLTEARKAYSRLGNKMGDADLSAEKRSTIRKRMAKFQVVIDHTSAEIERQKALQVEANEAGRSTLFDEPTPS